MDIWYLAKLILSTAMALLPALIWIEFINREKEKNPKLLTWIFVYGCFSVMPILGIQYLWLQRPEWDVYERVGSSVANAELGFLLTYVAVGVFEEIAKFSILYAIDRFKVKIKNMGDSVKYVVLVALGFAFIENILYFLGFLLDDSSQVAEIFYNSIFRSIFTTAAHMVFSGIVGYNYALAKFGASIMEQERWEGKKFQIITWLHNTFKIPAVKLYRLKKFAQGLGTAIILHATFNYFLHKGLLDAALLLVMIGAIIVYYLMKKSAGYVIFLSKTKKSMMPTKDEEVVVELLGMWLNQGRYKEVEEVCERLLKRDPDSNLVRLFKAKAHDKMKMQNAVGALKALFSKADYKEEKSLFEEFKGLKEKNKLAAETAALIPQIVSPEQKKVKKRTRKKI